MSTYAHFLIRLSSETRGMRSLRTTKARIISPVDLIHLLKEENGISDHKTLIPIYAKMTMSKTLSFAIEGQSMFLLKRMSRANAMRMLITKRSKKLPDSMLALASSKIVACSNQRPTGLDP